MPLQFDQEDNGNCRVYYRDGRKLYCWQNEGSWGRNDWKYYACSSDGEPSHEVKAGWEFAKGDARAQFDWDARLEWILTEDGHAIPF